MKKISDNSILELANLTADIQGEIKTYSHVAEFLPKTFLSQLKKLDEKIQKELNRREL